VEKQNENRGSLEGEIRRYILGELAAQDEQSFDWRLMTGDREFMQEVEDIVEVLHDDLVEDYISAKLSDAEKTAFEVRLLPCPQMREQIMLEKTLRLAAARNTRKKRSLSELLGVWIQPIIIPVRAAALCASLLLAGGGLFVYRIAVLRNSLDNATSHLTAMTVVQKSLRNQVGAERRRSSALTAQLNLLAEAKQHLPNTGSRTGVAVASFMLMPGSTRSGGQTARVAVGPGQSLVELKLDVGIAEYPRYRAALNDSEDNELIVVGKLDPVVAGRSVYVPLQLPARMLPPDDYRIQLSGVPPGRATVMIDSYPFRVVQQ
jgi:hypothetical protein